MSNVDPLLAKFLKKIEERLGVEAYTITSLYRPNGKTSKGKPSRHGKGQAVDFRPSEKLKDYLQNTKEGLELLIDHKLGFLDETSKEDQKKYGATGANFHIGKDRDKDGKLYGKPSSRLDSMMKGDIMALDPDWIVSQKTENYQSDALNEYENEWNAIRDDESNTLTEAAEKRKALDKKMYDEDKMKTLNLKKLNQGIQDTKEIEAFEKGENIAGLIYNISQKEDTTYDGEFVNANLSLKEYEQLKEQLPEKDFKSLKIQKKTEHQGGNAKNKRGKQVHTGYSLRGQTDQLYLNADKWHIEKTGKNLLLEPSAEAGFLVYNKAENPNTDALKRTKEIIVKQDHLIKVDPEWTPKEDETVVDETTGKPVVKKETKKDAELEAFNKKAEQEFASFMDKEEIISPDVYEYDTDNFQKQYPIGALAQGALGLMGLADADTELPLRDEKISQAIINFGKTNLKLSKMGLRPEEEAAMKADVADAYQEGMNQLVRASGGNRNLVTGNASALNLNRIKGITNIALADIQAKDAAFEKYGKTLEYIENFNTTRDVANHGIKLAEAQQKQKAGSDLAASGFAGMIEELQYQKENGPGSANHMLKQQLMFSSFGVVPGMKDNGLGDTPGTASYAKLQKFNQEKANVEKKDYNAMNQAFKTKVRGLSDTERKALPKDFWDQSQNEEFRRNWTSGLANPPQQQQQEQALPTPSPISEVGPANQLLNGMATLPKSPAEQLIDSMGMLPTGYNK